MNTTTADRVRRVIQEHLAVDEAPDVAHIIDDLGADSAALIYEAAEKHGLTHDGKIIKGVTGKVSFNGRKGGGSYTVILTRDPAQSGQAQIPAS